MVILLISISSSCLAPVSTPQITKSAAESSPHKCAINSGWGTFSDIKLGINISYPLGYFAGKTGVKIWTSNYNQACANRCAYTHVQITDLNHILTLNSVDPSALPHINKCVRDPPGEKCFGALKGMCLLSLAAATVVCLGWTQKRKNEALSNNSHYDWADGERQRKTKDQEKSKTFALRCKATTSLQDKWKSSATVGVLNKAAVPSSAHSLYLLIYYAGEISSLRGSTRHRFLLHDHFLCNLTDSSVWEEKPECK